MGIKQAFIIAVISFFSLGAWAQESDFENEASLAKIDRAMAKLDNYLQKKSYASTYFVKSDATGANDGSDWTDAFTSLQTALEKAGTGEEIWVAAGTYKPSGSNDREESFTLKDQVTLYGGFAGNETHLNQRDWTVNQSILSGDIGEESYLLDNSYHVLKAYKENGTVDGFTITKGYADGAGSKSKGGGMINYKCSPTIINCTFSDNYAENKGGAIYNRVRCSPSISNCVFNKNSSETYGGAIYNYYKSSPTISSCTFTENSSNRAGAIYSVSRSTPAIYKCTFSKNTSTDYAGAIFNNRSDAVIVDCDFTANESGTKAGAVYNHYSDTQFVNCIFSNNSSLTSSGGAVVNYGYSSRPYFTNCLFTGNSAEKDAGAIQNMYGRIYANNCTFYGNSAKESAGAIYVSNSYSEIVNCILWNNTAAEYSQIYRGKVSYSCLNQDNYAGEDGNINQDPLFQDAANSDFRLTATSPCVNTGTTGTNIPSTDIDGYLRDDTPDMGCYEYNGTEPTPVSLTMSVTPTSSGSCDPSIGSHSVDTGAYFIIKAVPADGYAFYEWSSSPESNVKISNTESATTLANISGDATIQVEFWKSVNVTVGSVVNIKASDASVSYFRSKPKIWASYTDPVKGKSGKKAPLKVVTKFRKGDSKSSLYAAWTKKVKLYNQKEYKKQQLSQVVSIGSLTCDRFRLNSKSTGFEDIKIGIIEQPPQINDVTGEHSSVGDKFTVFGEYFGSKPPKILIEYFKNGDSSKVKYKPCKLVKSSSLKYLDAKLKANKSCMKVYESDIVYQDDPKEVGYSEITVLYPKLKPMDEATGYIILKNKIGMAVYELSD